MQERQRYSFLKRAHNLFSLMDYMINNGILIHRAMSSTSMPRGGDGIAGDDDDDVSLNPRILSCHDNNRPPSCFDYWNKAYLKPANYMQS